MKDPSTILKAYTLPTKINSCSLISNGLINPTWKIVLENDTAYILQQINTRVFTDPYSIASNLIYLKEYLNNTHPEYLFVAPILTNNHQPYYITGDKKYYRLFPFIINSHTVNVVANIKQAFEAAHQFGKFTSMFSYFNIEKLIPTLPYFHDLSLRYQQFETAIVNGDPIRIETTQSLIQFLQNQSNIVDTFIAIQSNPNFKLRVTHHDTKISNTLFNDNDDGLCVIDLDTVMPGYFISDVGDMIRTYTSPVSEEEKEFEKIQLRTDYFETIVKGYAAAMKKELTSAEKDHFVYAGKFMIYMQALRFLTDHLNNDIYYGAKYEDHNLVRAQNQITLLQQLLKKENELQNIAAQFLHI